MGVMVCLRQYNDMKPESMTGQQSGLCCFHLSSETQSLSCEFFFFLKKRLVLLTYQENNISNFMRHLPVTTKNAIHVLIPQNFRENRNQLLLKWGLSESQWAEEMVNIEAQLCILSDTRKGSKTELECWYFGVSWRCEIQSLKSCLTSERFTEIHQRGVKSWR